MRHPDEDCNIAQAQYLSRCNPNDRRFFELSFKIGNATFIYHQRAKEFKPSAQDWREWLDGLSDPMKSDMEKRGFTGCLTVLSFTRYVNEKNDLGLDEFLQQHIPLEELKEFKALTE